METCQAEKRADTLRNLHPLFDEATMDCLGPHLNVQSVARINSTQKNHQYAFEKCAQRILDHPAFRRNVRCSSQSMFVVNENMTDPSELICLLAARDSASMFLKGMPRDAECRALVKCVALQERVQVSVGDTLQVYDESRDQVRNITSTDVAWTQTIPIHVLRQSQRHPAGIAMTHDSVIALTLSNMDALTYIGESTFHVMRSLRTLTLADLPALREIKHGSFTYMDKLTTLTIRKLPALTTFGKVTFQHMDALTTLNLSNLPQLGEFVELSFQHMSALRTLTFSTLPLLTRFGRKTFAHMNALTTLSFSDLPSLVEFGEASFAYMNALQTLSLSNVPAVDIISAGAFLRTPVLTAVNISNVRNESFFHSLMQN